MLKLLLLILTLSSALCENYIFMVNKPAAEWVAQKNELLQSRITSTNNFGGISFIFIETDNPESLVDDYTISYEIDKKISIYDESCNVANPSWLGDGWCDNTGGYNTPECNYDLGDCCHNCCLDGLPNPCGVIGYDCQDPNCQSLSWGLDRINQRDLPLNGEYDYPYTNSSVDIYVVDTGTDVSHPDFEGLAVWGENFIDAIDTDCNGHGTHVAGTTMSKTHGVDKLATSIAVKVLDCDGSGTFSSIINGLDWVVTSVAQRGKRGVVNLSLGGSYSPIINAAVKAVHDSNISVVVAAGNSNSDACLGSPASAPEAITVAASTITDNRAYFSSWGSCVELFAPGLDISSTWLDGKYNTISGTSMASPHVAGVVSILLNQNPSYSSDQITNLLLDTSTKNRITDLQGSPNTLLYV